MTKLLPPFLFVGCLLLALALHAWLPGRHLLPPPYPLVGLVFIALGILLLGAGNRRFVQVRTNIHTFRPPDVLVTDGVFRFTRNPMYLGFLLLLAGSATLLGSLTPWLAPLLFFLAAQTLYIPFEERACAARFGAAYADYRTRVRRWL